MAKWRDFLKAHNAYTRFIVWGSILEKVINDQLADSFYVLAAKSPISFSHSISRDTYFSMQWCHNESPASRLFAQPLVADQRTYHSYLSLATMTGGFPFQRASNADMFPFDDAIMFSCDADAVS